MQPLINHANLVREKKNQIVKPSIIRIWSSSIRNYGEKSKTELKKNNNPNLVQYLNAQEKHMCGRLVACAYFERRRDRDKSLLNLLWMHKAQWYVFRLCVKFISHLVITHLLSDI